RTSTSSIRSSRVSLPRSTSAPRWRACSAIPVRPGSPTRSSGSTSSTRTTPADEQARRTLSPLEAEYRLVAKSGRVVWVSEKAAVVEDESGALYWQGVMVDITARKTIEDALAASERQYRSVFDAAAIGLMTLDLDGVIR